MTDPALPSGPCPCGSGSAYAACCGPLHDGGAAPTAEALMRSRFSAFALKRADHLLRTVDPLGRQRLRAGDFRSSFALTWTRLEVVAVSGGGASDRAGTVHFRAHYRGPDGRDAVLEEVSLFARDHGEWVYRAAER